MASNLCWLQGYRPCGHDHDDDMLLIAGRCRSGSRWFWVAADPYAEQANVEGWAATEPEAVDAARDAIVQLAGGRAAFVLVRTGCASDALKRRNAAQRAARPAADTTDTAQVE